MQNNLPSKFETKIRKNWKILGRIVRISLDSVKFNVSKLHVPFLARLQIEYRSTLAYLSVNSGLSRDAMRPRSSAKIPEEHERRQRKEKEEKKEKKREESDIPPRDPICQVHYEVAGSGN